MRIKNALKIPPLSILLFLSFEAAAQWTQNKASGYYKLDFTNVTAPYIINATGNLIETPMLTNNILSFYGEYGITNRLTAQMYMPFLVHNTLAADANSPRLDLRKKQKNTAFGDVDIALKYALTVNKPIAVSASLWIGLPTGNAENTYDLVTGDGEVNQMLRLDVGKGFKKKWISGGIAFNNRTKNYSDELRYSVEYGQKWLKNERFYTVFRFTGIVPFKNGTATENRLGLYSNNLSFHSPALEMAYKLKKHWSVTSRLGFAVSAANVLGGPSLSLGVVWN